MVSLSFETTHSLPDIPISAKVSLIEELVGTFQYCPNRVHSLLNPFTRFFSTSPIASNDHRFIAMTRHTTNPDGNFRDRSSQPPVSDSVCLITDGEITISIALNINSASNVGVIKEKSFSCTSFSDRTSWRTIITLPCFCP